MRHLISQPFCGQTRHKHPPFQDVRLTSALQFSTHSPLFKRRSSYFPSFLCILLNTHGDVEDASIAACTRCALQLSFAFPLKVVRFGGRTGRVLERRRGGPFSFCTLQFVLGWLMRLTSGGFRVPSLPRRDGRLRRQLQALSLRVPGGRH